ncbi:hypothetical protein [Rhizobium rhizoryzae]|uniref:hypothetical protein n=1 Tax=Rhizobium rhizoryzae TaxID=451876 RepID=UPI00289ECB82|nr:hypothetical protein [Rhizobium rhizoryzae]
MAAPDTPTDDITLLGAVNGNAYDAVTNPRGLARGGHRQNWAVAMNALAAVAGWVADVTSYLSGLADQVAADAASAAAGSGTESSTSSIRAGTSAQYLSVRRIYDASAFVTLTDASLIAWDMSTAINVEVTLAAAGRTLANPTNKVSGKSGIIVFKQDATGGRSVTTWGSDYVWMGEQPVWPTAANAETIVSYLVRSNGKVLLNFGGSTA